MLCEGRIKSLIYECRLARARHTCDTCERSERDIDINSLAEFFIASMPKNGWKMAGSAKYKNVLLAFVKPNKTCTIAINDSEFGLKTDVFVYMTEDITNNNGLTQSMGFGSDL